MGNFDPELAQAIASNPLLTEPQTIPEGVPVHKFFRDQIDLSFAPWVEYWQKEAPPANQYILIDKVISVKGGEIPIRCVAPAGAANGSTYPVFVWFHSGGWVVNDYAADDYYLRSICVELQLVIFNVNYRLAPENPFPTSFEDSFAATKWVAENAKSFGGSTKAGFLVGGDSAGGGLASTVSLHARDDPAFAGKPITGQYLREPVTTHVDAWPEKLRPTPSSWEANKDTYLLSPALMMAFYEIYGAPPTDIRLSPLLAPSHANLPPAFIQAMGQDVLKDDAVVYEKVLREAGVSTKLVVYEQIFHSSYCVFPALNISKKVTRDAVAGLKWLLSQGAPTSPKL